ncbi:MAG: hypothetical protein EON91_00025 [Brevundimonas sp.]|uniref:hypothetical protein n=1 Tax=Brevundimonas sp. TaxID=1871086 RepID=UPI00122A4251|nr:hypothetical protein [Brevundimonas sp.]RZJ19655.1 MAG: hypothetical protein EON91_00025 [Brevundimonas sp.]
MRYAALLLMAGLAACGREPVNPPTEPAAPVAETPGEPLPPQPGLTPTVPGTGPASFVGRWAADAAWCAAPKGAERPIEITPQRFEGYENSCAIDAINQTAGAYDATLTCQSEGGTRRERVRMAASGQNMTLTWLNRQGAQVSLTKCTTLAETPELTATP